MTFFERLGALAWFLTATAWFLFSDLVAQRAADGFTTGAWQEPLYRLCLLFLLILGYWVISRIGQKRTDPAKATAIALRAGGLGEFGLGAALGWSGVVLCVLPTALIGGMVITAFTSAHQFWTLIPDLIALAAGTLAIEVAFRGYPFLRLAEALGPGLAAFFMAVVYAIWRTHTAPATTATILVSFFLGLVMAVAVLRTRALWVSWGFHFAWVGVMAMLFGLPVAGTIDYSPILVANPVGPPWITGDGQGPEGSAFAVAISCLLIFAMMRYTGDLKHKYGFPEIVPGGVPVDLEAAARRQHEAAIGAAEPAPPALVQILPAQPVGSSSAADQDSSLSMHEPPPPQAPPDSTPSEPATAAADGQSGEEPVRAEPPVSESDSEFPR